MNYRQIPHVNFQVSEIGLGCEHLEKKDENLIQEVIGTALDGGINIMDVFMPQPEVRTHIGNAIRHVRQKVYLQGHIGATLEDGQYKRTRDLVLCDEFIRDFLARFHTDYIDFGMIHFVDDLDDWHTIETQGILEYALQLKQKGIIRAIGLSSHAPKVALRAVQSGHIDVLMFSLNPMFDLLPEETLIDDLFEQKSYEHSASSGINPIRQVLYETCARMGVGITVMKTLAAGLLLGAETSPFGQPLSVAQCEHYALTRPGVASVLIGCNSGEQVSQALQYESLSAQEKDYTAVLNTSQRYSANGACMYCNHCLPCPSEIDIAAVHQYYDLAKSLSEVPATIREHYQTLHAHASDCIACSACEERCPFGVQVIQNMEKASALFGI